jgi:hypothetical protein
MKNRRRVPELEKSGYLKQVREFAMARCVPFFWSSQELGQPPRLLHNGTICYVDTGQRKIGIWMFFEAVNVLTPVSASASSHISSTTSGPMTVAAPLGVPNSIAPPPGSAPRPSTVMSNTQIESFMAHLRNLIEFMFTLKPGDTDVAAVDFCAPGAWKPVITQTLSDAKRRVNKELAHLTTERISGSPLRKQWDFTRLAQELRSHLQGFRRPSRPRSCRLGSRWPSASTGGNLEPSRAQRESEPAWCSRSFVMSLVQESGAFASAGMNELCSSLKSATSELDLQPLCGEMTCPR